MKTIFFCAALSILSFSSPLAWAGGGSFSGGFGRVCFKSEQSAEKVRTARHLDQETLTDVTTVETLDLLEATEPLGIDVEFPLRLSADASLFKDGPERFIYRIVDRVRYVDYSLAQRIGCIMKNESCEGIHFSSDFSLFDIENDAAMEGSLESPSCVVLALAVNKHKTTMSQAAKGKFNQYDIIIFEPLFKKMNVVDQGVLYLHELLYVIGRKMGHENSSAIRNLVAALVLEKWHNITVGAFIDYLYDFYHPATSEKRPNLDDFKAAKAKNSILYKKALPVYLMYGKDPDPQESCRRALHSAAFRAPPETSEPVVEHFCRGLFHALDSYATLDDHVVNQGNEQDEYLTFGITSQQVLRILESLVLLTEFP